MAAEGDYKVKVRKKMGPDLVGRGLKKIVRFSTLLIVHDTTYTAIHTPGK